MSKFKTLKTITAITGLAIIGGGAAFAGMHWDGVKKVAQGPVYSEEEVKESYDDGYNEGLKINVGYTDEDLENAKDEGRDEGYQTGFNDGVNYVPPEPVYADVENLNLKGSIFVHDIGNTKRIVSTSENEGIFVIDNENQTLMQIFDTGKGWDTFQTLSNGDCLIVSSNNSGALYFNYENCTITNINEDVQECNKIFSLENGDCIIGNKGVRYTKIYKFNLETKTIIEIFNYSIIYEILQLKNGDVLIAGADVLLYNHNTNTTTKVMEGYLDISNSYEFKNGNVLILSKSSSSGLHLYDSQNNVVQDLGYKSGYRDFYILANGNLVLPYCYNGSNTLIFNIQTNEITELSINIKHLYELDDERCLLSTTGRLYLLDESYNTTEIYTKSYDIFYKFSDGNVLLSSSDIGVDILIFKSDGEIETVGSRGTVYNVFETHDGNYLISARNNYRSIVYLYDGDLSPIMKESVSDYNIFKHGDFVFCENEDYIYRYNPQTKQFDLQSIK